MNTKENEAQMGEETKENMKEPTDFETFEEFRDYVKDKVPVQLFTFKNLYFQNVSDREGLKAIRLTVEEMDKNLIQKHLRNACVHHYLPLQKCRKEHYYLPFHCNEERLKLERCYYKLSLVNINRSNELFKLEKKMRYIDEIIAEKEKSQ